MWPRDRDQRIFVATTAGLILFAWVALWVWGQSPYARYLNHEEIGEIRLGDATLALLLVYVAGWTLMTAAMMLPTSLPLLSMFQRLTKRRPERRRLVGLVVLAYLGTWTAFGILAHLADWVLHRAVEQNGWLGANAWAVGAGTLLVAGVYQFTPLKYVCLDKCRSPLSFILQHWRGGDAQGQAFWLGVHHGIFCIGCCWSLMLLMFAVGSGNLGWMLALGTVMAAEKNFPWGRRLAAPVGIVLVWWGLLLTLVGYQSS